MEGKSLGCLMNIIVGLLGGGLGGWIFSLLNISTGDTNIFGQIIVAVIGACVLLWLVNLIFGRKKS